MQDEDVEPPPSRTRSTFEWRPDWTVVGGAVIFLILVGMWGGRVHAVLSRGDGLQAELVWRALLSDATTRGWLAPCCLLFINRDRAATSLLPSCMAPAPAKLPS